MLFYVYGKCKFFFYRNQTISENTKKIISQNDLKTSWSKWTKSCSRELKTFQNFLRIFSVFLNTVSSHNSHIFVRPKRCDYLGKCDYMGDCDYLGKRRISHRRYRLIPEKEDQEMPNKPQIQSCITQFFKNIEKRLLRLFV